MSRSIRIPQNASLEQAANICADHFLLEAPSSWVELHAAAKRVGFTLIPNAPVKDRGSAQTECAAPRCSRCGGCGNGNNSCANPCGPCASCEDPTRDP